MTKQEMNKERCKLLLKQLKLKFERDDAGIVKVIADGSEIVNERDFWFAWYAFHPDTSLYGK